MTGDNSTVLCMVLLSFAFDSALEQYETSVERPFLYNLVGSSSTSLVDVGLFARIQGKERVFSTMDGQPLIPSCKYLSSGFSHP